MQIQIQIKFCFILIFLFYLIWEVRYLFWIFFVNCKNFILFVNIHIQKKKKKKKRSNDDIKIGWEKYIDIIINIIIIGILNVYDGHHSSSKAISSHPHSISYSLSPSPNSPPLSDTLHPHPHPQPLPHSSCPHQCHLLPKIVEIN